MAGIYQHSPIEVASVERGYQHLGGCDVGCNGNVVEIAKAEKLVVNGAGRCGGASVLEVQKHVNFVVSYAGSHLLLAALLT